MIENLILVRHLKKAAPRPAAFYGSTDLDIEECQVKPVEVPVEHVYSSPMKRCLQTSARYFPGSRIQKVSEAGECDFGAWEGMTFDEIAAGYPAEVEQWQSDDEFKFPEGEKIKDFAARVEKTASELIHKNEKNILLVTHAGVIRFMFCHFLGISYKKSLIFNIDPGSFNCIKVYENGKGVAHKINSTGDQSWLKSL